MTKLLEIKGGFYTLVDDDVYDWARRESWLATRDFYVWRSRRVSGRWTTVRLHRLIVAAPSGTEVDHINGDTLDNRRGNLRITTRSQNMQNVHRARCDSTTGARGVELHRRSGKYYAYLYLQGRKKYLGSAASIDAAAVIASNGRRRFMTHAPECRG